MGKHCRFAVRNRKDRATKRGESSMEDEELRRIAPCSSLAADAIIRIGTAGAIWGLCSGPYTARKQGLSGVAQAAYVARSAGWIGFQSGLVAGIFISTRCGLQRYRAKDDVVNSVVAGAVAGVAVAVSTRNVQQGIGTACLVSIFGAATDYFNAISTPRSN